MKKLFLLPCLLCLLLASCTLREELFSVLRDSAPAPATSPTAVPSPSATPEQSCVEYEMLSGGICRCRDYPRGLSFIYPDEMTVLEHAISDAVVVTNGDFLFVVGRNVTDDYSSSELTPAEYIEGYVSQTVKNDAETLCGSLSASGEVTVLHEDIEGRSASAELLITAGGTELYIKTIMYLSTYSDGTVNHICKSIMAPADDTEAFNALALGVTGMGAARLR